MIGMERTILPGLAEEEFGVTSKTAIVSFIATFGLAKAVSNLLIGSLTERFTRRRILIAGWIIGIPVPLLLIWAPAWGWVIGANVLLGVNQGLAWSMTVNMKMDLAGPRRRGLVLGFNESAGYLSLAVVALLTGMIAGLLVGRFHDPEATFFKGVRQLPAAHFLSLDAGGLQVSRYWDLDPAREVRYPRDEDYLEHCRELFKEAVCCRLRSTRPVGILLSGGIDSTSVTAMAETLRCREHATQPIVAFTLLLDGIESDEWEAIHALEEAYGTEVHRIRPEGTDGQPLTPFEVLLNDSVTPHYDGFLTVPLTLAAAAARGCRALLTGFGADEQMEVAESVHLEDLLYAGQLGDFLKQFREPSSARCCLTGSQRSSSSTCSLRACSLTASLLAMG